MLANILRQAEWGQLGSFVSPAFFEVMPPGRLYHRARSILVKHDSTAFRDAIEARARSLRSVPLALIPTADKADPPRVEGIFDGLGDGVLADAERIVTLYFHQLFTDTASLIDLRKSAFSHAGYALQWTPSPWVVAWDPSFLHGLRSVYLGFYTDDDDAFRSGLSELGIASCEDLFREHFGGARREHTFHTKDFVDTFHKVFLRCKNYGLKLHPDFLALGVYLASLYDALEPLAVGVDVRACFGHAVVALHNTPLAHEAERAHALLGHSQRRSAVHAE